MEAKDMILICKALSDTNRLEIVRMLSDGEKCGCKILDKFQYHAAYFITSHENIG